MRTLKISAWTTLILGLISLLFLVLDFLALTDIWHGREQNLDSEWQAVSLSFVPIVLFYVSVFFTLFFVFKHMHKKQSI